MKVKVAQRVYQMSPQEAKDLLEVAAELVPRGIYGLKYKDYIEIRNDHMSASQIKAARRAYRRQGVRVYANL